jgi:murein DD-endopeptidase MepM/ murein hydrolase activator NlpD
MNRYSRGLLASIAALLIAGGAWTGTAEGGGGVSAEGTADEIEGGYAFPVRAKYSYGDGLGAGRNHQGQDIMASCGKKVVAARPGRVRIVDYQASGAGNFVVVKGKGYDYVYMHMLRRPVVSRGDRVQPGDAIGVVGSTGSSTACHLHFEMWTSPGWYRGGDVEDPKPYLRRWARAT